MPRVATIVINRNQPEMTDAVVDQVRGMGQGIDNTLYVVEAGSSRKRRSNAMTHWFWDPWYRGRYYAFNRGLDIARKDGAYDYFWFLVNDVEFPEGQDVLAELSAVLTQEPRMALIAPGEPDADDYEGCHPKPGRRWHKASTVHGLAWLMRAAAIDEVGYASQHFRYSQGAGTELAYKLYSAGWFLAYSDVVTLRHRGGSTYGKVVPISRHEYLRRARNFASAYFVRHYGSDWDDLFTSVLPDDVETNTFPIQRRIWERKLGRERRFLWFWKAGSWAKGALGLRRTA